MVEKKSRRKMRTKRKTAEVRENQVLECLTKGKRTMREISEELLLHKEYIRLILNQLAKKGMVKVVKVKNTNIYIPVKEKLREEEEVD